jgi:hypothetical protein
MLTKFQVLRCDVALAGDREQVVSRGRGNPVLFPELLVLQHLHGDDAVSEIAVVGEWDAPTIEVLERLRVIYPAEVRSTDVFPGTKPRCRWATAPSRAATAGSTSPPDPPGQPGPAADAVGQPDAACDAAVRPRRGAVPWTRRWPLSEAEVQAEMARMFGEQFPPDLEAAAPEPIVPETDQQFVQRTVATAMQGVTAERQAQPARPGCVPGAR